MPLPPDDDDLIIHRRLAGEDGPNRWNHLAAKCASVRHKLDLHPGTFAIRYVA